MAFFSSRHGHEVDVPADVKILESMVIPTFVLNKDRQVVLWNKALEELTGIPATQVMHTQDHWRGFYDAKRPCLADLMFDGTSDDTKGLYVEQTAGQTNGRSRRAENWCVMPAIGRRRYLIIDASSILDKNGKLVAVVETLRDITAEQEAKTALQAERDEQAKQVAAQLADACSSLGTALSAVADGNMIVRIDNKLPGAIDQLRESFNTAVAQLQDVLIKTTATAGTIRNGIDDIASMTDDLSHRTDQQAASLAETVTTLTRIMGTVKKTEDGATHASAVVAATKTNAERSSHVVNDAVDAMSGVSQSSNKIGQIIGVIDEIAFQTNLLALNAGVEAARAGDAGRGFAVVASEVRALAQRSAEAAKEIKSLISESAVHVQRGVDLVGQTGQALQAIVDNIADINVAVADITASAREQANELKDINSAIGQMDRVTQQNAGMVQDAAGVSRELVRGTRDLDVLMGQFQLDAAVAQPGQGKRSRPPVTSAAPIQAHRKTASR